MEADLVPVSKSTVRFKGQPDYAITSAVRRAQQGNSDYIPHLGKPEILALIAHAVAAGKGRKGERDGLLIRLLFDGCLRVSEALGVRPKDMVQNNNGWSVRIMGKGRKPGEAAISSSLAAMLQSYAYRYNISPEHKMFPVTPARAWQVVDRAFTLSGIVKPEHVGTVHVLRHSGALARLAATGNPKALQDQLRHTDAKMTLRYMKTLSKMESLRIQQQVEFDW